MRSTKTLVAVIAFCVVGAIGQTAAMQHPIFTGTWTIDLDRVDPTVKKNVDNFLKRGEIPQTLVITQNDDQMVMDRRFVKDSDTRIYRFDGTPYQSQQGPAKIREVGAWESLRFVVTITSTIVPRTSGRAPAVTSGSTQRIEISPEGKALSVSWPIAGKKNVALYYKRTSD